MPSRVYHWKHGWIPLDHMAAMSKAKGSESGARRALATSHAAGHAHESVVGGSYGGGTHVRGLQPVAAEHLPRAGHIGAAFDPGSRRFALRDHKGQRVGLSNQFDGKEVTTSIPERLGEHFQARGHKIVGLRDTKDGSRVVVETKGGDLKSFAANGSDLHRVDPQMTEPPHSNTSTEPTHDLSAAAYAKRYGWADVTSWRTGSDSLIIQAAKSGDAGALNEARRRGLKV